MNDFLQKDVRPSERSKTSEHNVAKKTTKSSAVLSNSEVKKVQDEKKALNHELRKKGRKKKAIRQERALQKMREKGINIMEVGFNQLMVDCRIHCIGNYFF